VLGHYLRIAGLTAGLLGYVWFSAVNKADTVKNKKADRREATLRLRG
jgi:hypothetical protein